MGDLSQQMKKHNACSLGFQEIVFISFKAFYFMDCSRIDLKLEQILIYENDCNRTTGTETFLVKMWFSKESTNFNEIEQ